MNNYSFLRPIARPEQKVNALILRDENLLLLNKNSEKANRKGVAKFSPRLVPTRGWRLLGHAQLPTWYYTTKV
jgi:hypothetical protein